MTISKTLSATLLLSITLFSSVSKAGCWPVFQGIHTTIECDSSGVTPTFNKFKHAVREAQGLSPECKRSIVTTAATYFGCGAAILSAATTGGATVWVGAGEACYEFSKEVQNNGSACRQYVNLRTKPTAAKICNNRNEHLNVSIGTRMPRDMKLAGGWLSLNPGQCLTIRRPKARVIYAMAVRPNGGTLYPDYGGSDIMNNATFCINKHKRFDRLGVNGCYAASGHNPGDYYKPGSYKFAEFGRISGLRNGFTFN